MSPLAEIEAEDRDGVRVVHVSGEVDLSNTAEVMAAVRAAVPTDALLVVMDFSRLSYLDSSGIAMLFSLAQQLTYRRQELRLVVPEDSPVRRVLELTDMPRVIPIDTARD